MAGSSFRSALSALVMPHILGWMAATCIPEPPGPMKPARDMQSPLSTVRSDALSANSTTSHTKIGRNDPCPCGSGKKFKKCCLGKEPVGPSDGTVGAASDFFDIEPQLGSTPGLQIQAYTLAKLMDDPDRVARLSGHDRASLDKRWSPCKFVALSTEEIEEGLRSRGVAYSREAFLAATLNRTSAWGISRAWGRLEGRDPMDFDDFVGLAACELWRRFCPERPSLEMIDDWITDGYARIKEGRRLSGLECWMKAWEGLKPLLPPGTRNLAQIDRGIFVGRTQFLSNWARDFCLESANGSLSEPAGAPIGIRFLEGLMEALPDEAQDLHFRNDLATLYFRMGQPDQGRARFEKLISEYPDQAIGYVGLASELGFGRNPKSVGDLREAIGLLESALAYPVKDPRDYDVAARLKDLRKTCPG